MQDESMGSTSPIRFVEFNASHIAEKICGINRRLGGSFVIFGQLMEDFLSIVVMYMKSDIILPHVSLKFLFEYHIHERLLLPKGFHILSSFWNIIFIKDVFAVVRSCCHNS